MELLDMMALLERLVILEQSVHQVTPGADGLVGPSGDRGQSGGCDHCPPPRTAPGY
ncbi:hypothetical protein KIN20_028848 [Parelaphostrongylus tenuis]|uniref:Uncharacterized protein n=1 Tax=Parelaphostrongylus tenuis TaxID=148309 RepID=A0AAD5R1H5_PARTN|nr:hypothetical protein KIN20_028848 [Parelaphostrongylus tenuis]